MVEATKTYNNKNFTVHIFYRDGKIIAAEKYLTRDPENDDYHQEMGLTVVGKKLDSTDGVFFLPIIVARALILEGIDASSLKNHMLDSDVELLNL
jgi:hypothetical protein